MSKKKPKAKRPNLDRRRRQHKRNTEPRRPNPLPADWTSPLATAPDWTSPLAAAPDWLSHVAADPDWLSHLAADMAIRAALVKATADQKFLIAAMIPILLKVVGSKAIGPSEIRAAADKHTTPEEPKQYD